MNKLNNYFTTNQTLTLQNFTLGGGKKYPIISYIERKLKKYMISNNMIKFTVYL